MDNIGSLAPVTFNFSSRSITQSGVDITAQLDVLGSNWWDENQKAIMSGNNSVKVTGGAWDISFYHASE